MNEFKENEYEEDDEDDNYKEHYVVDFTNVKNYFDMHFIIRDSLDFPDYYGCNWDAFWDCLTDMLTLDGKIHIEIIGLDVIKEKFDDSADKIVKILKKFKKVGDDCFADKLQIDIIIGDSRISLT